MSRLIPTKQHNPCPICGDTKGNCRTTNDDNLILCMTGAGNLINAVNGYKYRKDSKDGLWGIYTPDNSSTDNFNREEWLKQKAEAQRQKRIAHKKSALPIKLRDKHYRKISKSLGLASEHQQDLTYRGLNQSQIEKLNSFTIEGITHLPDDTPLNLPCVRINKTGEKYFSAFNPPDENNDQPTPSRAYFCPAFNFDGKIIGGQFRHNRQDNKYTWLSGIKNNNLPDGEIPITIVRAENITEIKFSLDTSKFGKEIKPLSVLEGFLKPFISTCKWGIDGIGASGFNYRNSHNQVKETVEKGGYNLAIFPLDANLVNNPHLIKRLAENIQLFQLLGCQIAIAWWGQDSKSEPDFDELENLDNVELLTIDEFTAITEVCLEENKSNLLPSAFCLLPSIDNSPEIIDPIHGKFVLSGKEALKKAQQSISELSDEEKAEIFGKTYTPAEFEQILEEREFTEFQQKLTQEYLNLSTDELRKAESEFTKFQEELIRKFNHLSRSYKRGYDNQILRLPNLYPETVIYNPDTFYLTIREDFTHEPQIIIPTKYKDLTHKVKILNHLRAIGCKHIFINWDTGEGKSQTVSKLNRILYLDNNYKNPPIPELQKAPSLTPRTYYGLYYVNGEIQADPDESIREWAKSSEFPNVYLLAEGNCVLKPAFRSLQSKGYGVEENRLPCQKCQFKKNCSFVEGKYKQVTKTDIRDIIGYGQGRMHPSQLTREKLKTSFEYWTLTWEEIGTLETTHDYLYSEFELKDLHFQLSQAPQEIIEPQKRDKLLNAIARLIYLLNPDTGKEIAECEGKYYGLTHEQIMEMFKISSILPEFEIAEYLSLIKYLIPDIDELIPDTNYKIQDLSYSDRKWKSLKRRAEQIMTDELKQEMFSKLSQINTNPLLLLDAIFSINQDYILSTQKIPIGRHYQWFLAVTTPNYSLSELSGDAKCNIYIDATATATQVKAIFNIQNEPLITVSTESIALENTHVFNINISGLGSNEWSQDALKRVKTGIDVIREQNLNMKIAVMCPKKYANELNTQFWYGKHDRGTNELMGYDAIIFCGTPFINVGAVKREYDILFRNQEDKPTFEQFYNQKIYELRMQEVGRQRGQHFLDKQLHQFFITTNEDLSYLKEKGLHYQQLDGEMLSPELAKKGDRTLLKIQSTVLNFIQSGIKATCEAVGKALDLTKQAVSKAIKGLGMSWKEFIKCQLRLYELYKGKVDKIQGQFWELQMDENPLQVINLAIDSIKENGIDGFITLIQEIECPYIMASRLLFMISGLFDERLPEILLGFNPT